MEHGGSGLRKTHLQHPGYMDLVNIASSEPEIDNQRGSPNEQAKAKTNQPNRPSPRLASTTSKKGINNKCARPRVACRWTKPTQPVSFIIVSISQNNYPFVPFLVEQ